MFWPNAYRLPKWILSTAAIGMLAVPVAAQNGLSSATGKPTIKPVSRTTASKPAARSAAPAVPPVEEAIAAAPSTPPALLAQQSATDGDSAVQKELRRLYQENGREAPEVPTPAQMQAINGRTAAPPPMAQPVAPYGTYGAAPQRTAAAAPPPSAPTRTSRNPVVSFFQRLVPGRESKPVNNTAAAGTTGPVTNPTISMRQAPPPARNYAPYNGAQPQRLPQPAATPAPNAVAATPSPIPSPIPAPAAAPRTMKPVEQQPQTISAAPVNVAERLQLERDLPAVTQAPVVTPAQTPVRAEIIAAPQTPVVTGPSLAQNFTARPAVEEEPIFEEPVMVEAETESPFEPPMEVELGAEAPMETEGNEVAAAQPQVQGDFPEPFPEEDEKEADEEVMESPFSGGLELDEEPIVAKPIPAEADPLTEVVSEPAPLTVAASNTAPTPAPTAPTIELEADSNIVAAPVEAQTIEDDEFFPADKPMDAKATTEEPVLTLPNNDPVIAVPTNISPEAAEYAAKMQKIKDRGGMKGLKGFCPVTLRDERELKDAKPEFHSQFRGQKFHFASAEAKAKFDQAPANYAPAAYGADVVVLTRDKDVAEGTLDFAAWFKGQLYLFSSEETHAVFTDDPAKFATPIGIE